MILLDLERAASQIRQTCQDAQSGRRRPFFFLVGAGVSHPSVPLASEIEAECKRVAGAYGRADDPPGTTPIVTYSHWFQTAYPSPRQRQTYLRNLIEAKPISQAIFRLAHLLEKGVSNLVVTPNFDDFIARALTLFGRSYIISDHPRTAERIDPDADDIQIVHVHGTYLFYDCCNLQGEIERRAEAAEGTAPNMPVLLQSVLEHRSPLVIGYAGWDGDVIMTALHRRMRERRLPYNVYWFCHRRSHVDDLPAWLKNHPDVSFVVPPDSRSEGAEATLAAEAVLDHLIQTFMLRAPDLTVDPLTFFAGHLRRSLPGDDSVARDDGPYFLRSVVDRIERASRTERELDSTRLIDSQLDQVRDAVRRSQYREAIRLASQASAILASDWTSHQLRGLIDAVWSAVSRVSDDSNEELLGCDLVVTLAAALARRRVSEPGVDELVGMALIRKGGVLEAQNRLDESVTAYDEVIRRLGEATEPGLRRLATEALERRYSRLLAARHAGGRGMLRTGLGPSHDFGSEKPGAGMGAQAAELVVERKAKELDARDIVIPTELGYLIEMDNSTTYPALPVVVYVNEPLKDYDADRRLIEILEGLITQHALRLVMVEGGEGDVGLAYLRRFGPPSNRREVADKYLRAGVLSAEEYLDIVTEFPLTLWGVESNELHAQHVAALLEAETREDAALSLLNAVRGASAILRPKLDPGFHELETQTKAFDAHATGLGDYAAFMGGLARRCGIGEAETPQLSRFLILRQLERELRLDEVRGEQAALIGELTEIAEEKQLEAFVNVAEEVKAGKVANEEFYRSLGRLARAARADLARYPNLSRYLRHIEESGELDSTALAEELSQLSGRLRKELPATAAGRELRSLGDQVDLIEKLVRLRLSPTEYQRLRELRIHDLFSRWANFLSGELSATDVLDRSWLAQLDELEGVVPIFLHYFEIGVQRAEVMAQNVIAKLSETREQLAVLITGGFHSPEITRRLRQRGVGFVVVVLKVAKVSEELDRAVIKYKSGHGSLEDLMAIASRQVSEAEPRQVPTRDHEAD